nr:transient receptor potential cation channel subfamily A member 1-like isoform X2 [Hydra vulgaris]XP_047128807.1 transient receptor potential cation channel subfamily A member 1-like isoform X2 [Hydra vulgaris]
MVEKEKQQNTNHILSSFPQHQFLNILLPSDQTSKPKKGEVFNKTSLLTFHQAARDGKLDIVEKYLKLYGKDKKKLNKKDEENTTALHYAVRYGHFPIVKILVENGANVNIPGEYGATPLHFAARYIEKNDFKQINSEIQEHASSALADINDFTHSNVSDHKVKSHDPQKPNSFLFSKNQNHLDRKLHLIKNERKQADCIESNLAKKFASSPSMTPVLMSPSMKHLLMTSSMTPLITTSSMTPSIVTPSMTPSIMTPSMTPPLKRASTPSKINWKSLDHLDLPNAQYLNSSKVSELNQNYSGNPVRTSSDLSEYVKEKFGKIKTPFNKRKRRQDTKDSSILKYLLEQQVNVNAKDMNGSTPLHYAAMRGNAIAAEMLLLQKNINIEAIDQSKMTPLHCSSSAGSYNVCHLLLEYGAKILCQDKENMTPLHFAAMEGHLDIAKLLFEYAEIQGGTTLRTKLILSVDREEQSALHLAVENNHIDIVKFCIEKGLNVNSTKSNMISPLHLACTSGLLNIAKLLVDNGAVIDAKNSLQETPLHRAALFNRTEIIDFLMTKGVYVDCCDKDNETPLLMAVRKNNVESVKLLLKYHADINVKDANDKTCLFIAAEENSREAFEILSKYDISNLLEEFDKHEMTPLHIAAKKGNENIVQSLLSLGARIDAKSHENLTPLHLAARSGHSRIVQILLSNVLSIVNDLDDFSNTPLHLAAIEGHVKIVEMLIEAGSAIDTRNAKLMTPLDCAAYHGWSQCTQCLLDADSSVNPSDEVKVTPLHLACKEGHVDIVNLLLSRNADVTRRDNLGKNCLDYAIENNQRDAAIAIIRCNNWKHAMRNSTIEGNKLTTPMRKLIQKLPDVAEIALNQCMLDNGLPPEHLKYKVTCSYEFLEDMFSPWCRIDSDGGEQHNHHKLLDIPHRTSIFSIISQKSMTVLDEKTRRKDFIQNHPLKFMVKYKCTKLLSHPLVTYFLRHKWSNCGRYVYYSRLFLYMIFLLFITGYGLSLKAIFYETISNETVYNEKIYNEIKHFCVPDYKSSSAIMFFIDPGRYIVIILSCISLGIELIKFLNHPYHYLHMHRVLELTTYVCSLIYATFSFSDKNHLWCSRVYFDLGGATLTLAWLGLVLFLRKFPKLGIYVVMFTHVLKTFAQIFPVLFLFVIAFGLGMHMVMFNVSPTSFSTPGRGMGKIIIGMMGEYEFDNIFNNDYDPMVFSWFLQAIFIVVNCIILMNLLIGLAVKDIEAVQKKAELKRLTMMVNLTLDIEKALPVSIQKQLVKLEESVYPNTNKSWNFWFFWSSESSKKNLNKKNNMKTIKKEHSELKETVISLRRRMKAIEAQNGRVEDMLIDLSAHLNINERF